MNCNFTYYITYLDIKTFICGLTLTKLLLIQDMIFKKQKSGGKTIKRKTKVIKTTKQKFKLPGGVPQQRLLSSTCSTSKPINQVPNETSSLAYLCSIGLRSFQTKLPSNDLRPFYGPA